MQLDKLPLHFGGGLIHQLSNIDQSADQGGVLRDQHLVGDGDWNQASVGMQGDELLKDGNGIGGGEIGERHDIGGDHFPFRQGFFIGKKKDALTPRIFSSQGIDHLDGFFVDGDEGIAVQ